MKRRDFLKAFAGASATPYIPVGLTLGSFASKAKAAPVDYSSVGFSAPSAGVMPQVINIFLYGGPSELAGNLSNIQNIEVNSQNSYRGRFGNNFTELVSSGANNAQITTNRFWQNAGGLEMEAMLAANDMSIYRTMTKVKSPTRSHRESLFLSHKGTLDIDGTPGIGTRLAAFLSANKAAVEAVPLADGTNFSAYTDGLNGAILPFVSFEGETNSYAPDLDLSPALPLQLRGLTLNEEFDNPYNRRAIICCGNDVGDDGVLRTAAANPVFDALVAKVQNTTYLERFDKANNGFTVRGNMDSLVSNLQTAADETLNPLPVGADYTGSSFSNRVKAAVTLALHNPSSFYITVGGGLGGWDDHNNGVERYPGRMRDVMQTMQAAMAHINGFSLQTTNGANRNTTDNIVINMFGDFGRLVNLNDSSGWDHANTQNLYTFGGADVRPTGALGKVVGVTERTGTSKTNQQSTTPVSGAYQFEPMAVASTVYSYFGAQNPDLLTTSPDSGFASGEAPIDETQAAVQQSDYTET